MVNTEFLGCSNILNIVIDYLIYSDFNHFSLCFSKIEIWRNWKLKQRKACLVLKRFFRFLKADLDIKKKFIKKLFSNKKYRRKYIFVHDVPSPHICLKREPPYFLKRGIKNFKQYTRYLVKPTLKQLENFLSDKPLNSWNYYLFLCDNLDVFF